MASILWKYFGHIYQCHCLPTIMVHESHLLHLRAAFFLFGLLREVRIMTCSRDSTPLWIQNISTFFQWQLLLSSNWLSFSDVNPNWCEPLLPILIPVAFLLYHYRLASYINILEKSQRWYSENMLFTGFINKTLKWLYMYIYNYYINIYESQSKNIKSYW